jgi:hypothetical protein
LLAAELEEARGHIRDGQQYLDVLQRRLAEDSSCLDDWSAQQLVQEN